MNARPKLKSIAVVGSGYMGGEMAQCFALAGHDVVLADADAEGLFPEGSATRIVEALTCADSIEDAVADADYIAEAVPEAPAIKDQVLRRVSACSRTDAVIASNTSAIPIAELALSVAHPERFLGVHSMNPAPFVPAVELIPTADTGEGVTLAVDALISNLGKVTCVVPDLAGFIANRLQFALFRESILMVQEGSCSPEQIDAVVSSSFGFRLAFFGPFTNADMAGLDVYAGAFESLARAYGERFSAPQALLDRVAAGDLGLKTGGGFTGLDPSEAQELLRYRNRAHSALSRLKADLGEVPGQRKVSIEG
jgi:3-hydroxybutyryl-CoA dehydrogenase